MYAAPVQELIDELGRLPGIGPKSAQRIAFYILKSPAEDAARLASSINAAKTKVTWCRRCFNVAEGGEGAECCHLHRRPARPGRSLRGGRAPRRGRRRKDGRVPGPVPRAPGRHQPNRRHRPGAAAHPGAPRPPRGRRGEGSDPVHQSQHRGRCHGLVPGSLLKDLDVKVTRIASGLPVGGDLEYADELTLGRALEGRREVS